MVFNYTTAVPAGAVSVEVLSFPLPQNNGHPYTWESDNHHIVITKKGTNLKRYKSRRSYTEKSLY